MKFTTFYDKCDLGIEIMRIFAANIKTIIIMKNLILSVLLLFLCFITDVSPLYSQEKDVTKFLGIPVDGFKSEMIEKLKAKGYEYSSYLDRLEGEFNGIDVYLSVVTNNNKVYRIAVFDQYGVSETDIKIRYNTLCQQFENNKRYFNIQGDQTLSDSEDISYEMSVHNKRYEAIYYQLPSSVEVDSLTKKAIEHFQTIYPGLNKENMTETIEQEVKEYLLHEFLEPCCNKCVWFMIFKEYGEYKILMYYDNVYNQANGEDL